MCRQVRLQGGTCDRVLRMDPDDLVAALGQTQPRDPELLHTARVAVRLIGLSPEQAEADGHAEGRLVRVVADLDVPLEAGTVWVASGDLAPTRINLTVKSGLVVAVRVG